MPYDTIQYGVSIHVYTSLSLSIFLCITLVVQISESDTKRIIEQTSKMTANIFTTEPRPLDEALRDESALYLDIDTLLSSKK